MPPPATSPLLVTPPLETSSTPEIVASRARPPPRTNRLPLVPIRLSIAVPSDRYCDAWMPMVVLEATPPDATSWVLLLTTNTLEAVPPNTS